MDARYLLRRLPDGARQDWESLTLSHRGELRTVLPLAQYWADGCRTLLEVADLVDVECGICDVELVVRIFRALEAAGLAELQPV